MSIATQQGRLPLSQAAERFRAIDWLRGLSVLFMIECHALFYLRPDLEQTPAWAWLQAWNGMVSVSFLFAAGFAAGLVGTRAMSPSVDSAKRRQRAMKTLRRIGMVAMISLFFRVSAFPVTSQPIWLVKFDILTCICVGLLCVWAILNLCRTYRAIAATLIGALLIGVLAATPWAMAYRGGEVVTGWLNSTNGSMFTPFPFMAYLLFGALLGMAATVFRHGRWVVVAGLVGAVGVGLLLGETAMAGRWWAAMGPGEFVFPLPNLFERVWKLGLIALVLFGIEALWPLLQRGLAPVMAVLEFFSGYALSAYLVHLSLLYGFCGMRFTHAWHRNASWSQYTLRVLALIAATAAICHVICLLQGWLVATWQARRSAQSPAIVLPDAPTA